MAVSCLNYLYLAIRVIQGRILFFIHVNSHKILKQLILIEYYGLYSTNGLTSTKLVRTVRGIT